MLMPNLALMHVNDDDISKAEEAMEVEVRPPVINGGEDDDRYSISLLFIRTVLQRVFAIMLGMEPEWVEALKLLNKLAAGAPLAVVDLLTPYFYNCWPVGTTAPTGTTKAHRRYRDHLWTFAVYRSPVGV
jgi:hypothetical protein